MWGKICPRAGFFPIGYMMNFWSLIALNSLGAFDSIELRSHIKKPLISRAAAAAIDVSVIINFISFSAYL